MSDQDPSRSDSPLIAAIAARLVASIQDGSLPEGHALPSERDLSLQYGASRGIIRAAIREVALQGLIEAKARCRPVVLKHRGGAVSAATSRPHIGIWLWPNTAHYAAASILRGIQSADVGTDTRLMIANAMAGDWDSIFDAEAKFLESIAEDPVDAGVIVWYLGGERNIDALWKLHDRQVPMVFVDRLPPNDFPADFVGTDNESAARRGVQHLIGLGHRNIGLLSNIEQVSSVREREAGYRRALKEAGIPVRDDLIFRDRVDGPEGVEAALDTYLSLDEPPTAIFAVNDHIALQVYEALQDRKISVPQQMSVLGFDGLLRWVPGGGYLTTLSQDFERIGQMAAEIVTERIAGGRPNVHRHVLLDATLLERGSTASAQNLTALPHISS